MKTFKTKTGIELPLLNLRGKDYLQVAHRLVWFRSEKPLWGIETEIIATDDKKSTCKATIKDESGRIIATAHKTEELIHFPDHLEKAETSAIGRALAACGYGTQFAPELDEADRIVDGPMPRREPAPTPAGPSEAQLKRLFAIKTKAKWPDEDVKNFIHDNFKIDSSKKLNPKQYKDLCEFLENNPYQDN